MAGKTGLSLQCRLVQSCIKEDKVKGDAVIVTKFVGEAIEGLFKKFSNQLEDLVFKTRCWETVKTGQLEDAWVMVLRDGKSDEEFARIKACIIENVAVKFKDGELEVTMTIQHRHSRQQPSLEAAISTTVMLVLEKDTEILPGAVDAEEA